MLLALLILVVGRLGGPVGGPAVLLELDGAVRGGARPRLSFEGALFSSGVPARKLGGGIKDGGGALLLSGGGGVPIDAGGGGVPLTDRGPARGGGGVAVLGAVFSAPGFLLTQRLRSGSYTKLLASPSLALMGLLVARSGGGDSAFLPPNHPEKPQLFLVEAWAAARFAIKGVSTLSTERGFS